MGKNKIGLLACAIFCWSTAAAVEWDVEPSINVAETYTDNLNLSVDSLKEDEFITEILPSIKLKATGKQFEADFVYRLQGLLYSRRDEFDETLDYSSIGGTATLVDNTLFVNFNGSLSQQIIDPGGSNPISAVTRTNNRSEVLNFSVSPYWTREIGKTSRIMIGYSAGVVEYDEPSATDSKNGRITATISGSPPLSSWSWQVGYSDSQIDYDTGSEVSLTRTNAELGWAFSNKTQLFIGGGEEDNKFNRLTGAQKIDGSFWHLGLRGELDRLTTYEISAGEEHFGESYGLSILRTAGKLTTDISYLEETTTSGYQQADYEALFEFLTNISGVELPEPQASVYVRKRLSAEATLELARSRIRFNAYNEDRDYLTAATRESDGVFGTALSWSWTARPRSTFSIDAGWQQLDLRRSTNTPEDVRLQFRYQQKISDSFSMNLRAWRNSRFATEA
ncbi:MAG: TIGR03016 family PEP-CTERM system-associated outer membrane protein, partial [Gammaproteobacteria bacterium]|nr:TIGR03016 family PEP-CTERM system-associated outer membrane protein [Gammaproteobacteria bacterium]